MSETYTLQQLHDHCTQNGYPAEADRLESYMELQETERIEPPQQLPSKQWKEALATQRAAA